MRLLYRQYFNIKLMPITGWLISYTRRKSSEILEDGQKRRSKHVAAIIHK